MALSVIILRIPSCPGVSCDNLFMSLDCDFVYTCVFVGECVKDEKCLEDSD